MTQPIKSLAWWHSQDKHATVLIRAIGIPAGADHRQQYQWVVAWQELLVKGSPTGMVMSDATQHLMSGVGDPIDAGKALESFSSFMSAWQEALAWIDRGHNSENESLFPMVLRDFAEMYAEELAAYISDLRPPTWTQAQADRLRDLCHRYGVTFDPSHYYRYPDSSNMMPGWVEGWVGGRDTTIYVGVSPEGDSHS